VTTVHSSAVASRCRFETRLERSPEQAPQPLTKSSESTRRHVHGIGPARTRESKLDQRYIPHASTCHVIYRIIAGVRELWRSAAESMIKVSVTFPQLRLAADICPCVISLPVQLCHATDILVLWIIVSCMHHDRNNMH
jgi:hypothetical protein